MSQMIFLVKGYDNTSIKVESGVQNNVIHDLLQKRQILMAELNNYTKASNEGQGIPVSSIFFFFYCYLMVLLSRSRPFNKFTSTFL